MIPRIKIERRCMKPYYLKNDRLYIHPDDMDNFVHSLEFVSIACFPTTEVINEMQIGRMYGTDIFIQDDMQIILLAIKGTRNEDQDKMQEV